MTETQDKFEIREQQLRRALAMLAAGTAAGGKHYTDDQIMRTAESFLKWIETGKIPQSPRSF